MRNAEAGAKNKAFSMRARMCPELFLGGRRVGRRMCVHSVIFSHTYMHTHTYMCTTLQVSSDPPKLTPREGDAPKLTPRQGDAPKLTPRQRTDDSWIKKKKDDD